MAPILLLALALQLPAAGRDVHGVVIDASGAPVAGAAVRLHAGDRSISDTVSRADGTFAFDAAPDAPLTVVVSAPGFADRSTAVDRDAALPVRILLAPRGITETVNVSAAPERLRLATPVSATVLDARSLAEAPALTLDDQLRTVPGFSLFRRSSSRVANPTTQGVTLRGLAASGASRTAVTADGQPLNDPFGGWVYWDRVPTASIERIEVARGGTSDLHGSDALGGAIRISTSEEPGVRLWLDGGTQSTARVSSYAARRFGGWTAGGAFEASTTDGFVIVAPESRGPVDVPAFSKYTSAAARVSAPLHADASFDVRGSYFTEDRGNGTPFQSNATIVRALSGRAAGTGLGGVWTVRGSGASQDYDQTFSAVAADRASERPTSLQHVDAGSAGLDLEYVRSGARHASLVGVTVRDTGADLLQGPPAGPFGPTEADQRTAAATVQTSIQPGGPVSLGAGIRAEFWTSEGGESESRTIGRVGPRASIAWRVSPDVSVRTAVHRAYRMPTMNELHRPFRVGNVVTNANAALDPESSVGIEAALFARRGPAALRVVGFWSRLSDAIVNVTLESEPSLIVRQRQNAGRIRAAGIEVEADARVARAVSLTASAAWIDSVFTDGAGLDGLRVPQVPRLQVSAGLQGAWRRASLALDWRYVGAQFDDDRNQFRLEPSGMVNARAGWRMRPSLELFAAMENAFDEEQDVGRTPIRTIGLPRTVRVGVRWALDRASRGW